MTPFQNNNNNNHMVRNSLAAGSVAGMASTLACHPFDVLRVKMQSTTSGRATTTTGVMATLRHTLQQPAPGGVGGIRALYTGLTLPLLAQAAYKATVFTVNTWSQEFLVEWRTTTAPMKTSMTTSRTTTTSAHHVPYKITMIDRFLCGCMGGAVNAALFVTPVEYVRNQQIAQQSSPSSPLVGKFHHPGQKRLPGPLSVIKNTIFHSPRGALGLWRGMTSTVVRDSVGCGCFFVAMAYTQELLLSNVSNNYDDDDKRHIVSSAVPPPSLGIVMTSGAVAGIAFWAWALPWDTLKTWIQTETTTETAYGSGSSVKMKNLRQALVQLPNHPQGISALFRGWQVAYGRGAPSAAITVVTYSFVFDFLNNKTTTNHNIND